MNPRLQWTILVFSVCLGIAAFCFFVAAGASADMDQTARILNVVSGGICLVVAMVLLIFTGIMLKISK